MVVEDTADHPVTWEVVGAGCRQWALHLTWPQDTPILIPTLILLHPRAVLVVVVVVLETTVADPLHLTEVQEVPCRQCPLVANPTPCTTHTTPCTTHKWRVPHPMVCPPDTPCLLVTPLAAVMVVVAVGGTGVGVPEAGAGAGVGHQGGAGLLDTEDTLPAGTDPDPVHPRIEEATHPGTAPHTQLHVAPGVDPPPPEGTIWQHTAAACL